MHRPGSAALLALCFATLAAPRPAAAVDRICFALEGHAFCTGDEPCSLDVMHGTAFWPEGLDAGDAAACCADRAATCLCARSCASDPECRADERCDPEVWACVPLDDPCGCADDASCPAGTACGETGACVPAAEPCAGDAACGDRGFCLGGTCQPFPDCWHDDDCEGGSCVDGSCRYASCDAERPCVDGWCFGGFCVALDCPNPEDACPPPPCSDDAACGAGFWCERGVCLAADPWWPWCATDAACGSGDVCVDAMCEPAWCVDDTDCPADRSCVHQLCRTCRADANCEPGQICAGTRCVEGCRADDDCVGGFCVDDVCIDCRVDEDCGSDGWCAGGQCGWPYDGDFCGADDLGDDGADASACSTAGGATPLALLAVGCFLVARRRAGDGAR